MLRQELQRPMFVWAMVSCSKIPANTGCTSQWHVLGAKVLKGKLVHLCSDEEVSNSYSKHCGVLNGYDIHQRTIEPYHYHLVLLHL